MVHGALGSLADGPSMGLGCLSGPWYSSPRVLQGLSSGTDRKPYGLGPTPTLAHTGTLPDTPLGSHPQPTQLFGSLACL